jgi:cytochrome P450
VEKRKDQPNLQADVLGVLLAAQGDPQAPEDVKNMDINFIVAQIILVWFAAYDTTATTLTWTLKFLLDYPETFQRVQVMKLMLLAQQCGYLLMYSFLKYMCQLLLTSPLESYLAG